MPAYTADEINQQIEKHEGVKVDLHAKGQPDTVRFRMAYHEFYPERLGDEATVAELKLRIYTFLHTQSFFPET